MKKICLIVTSSSDFLVINRLFHSLNVQNVTFDINIFFVNQHKLSYPGFLFEENITLNVIEVNKVISLSKARNLALLNINLSDFDVIAFPDDDCWYEDSLIKNIFNFFDSHLSYDVLCTNVLDPSNNKTYGGRPKGITIEVNERNIFSYPISVGIFIKLQSRLSGCVIFDETLGAGTDVGSGEETDLVYRLLKNGAKCLYLGDLFVYHPVIDGNYCVSDIKKYYKYGVGFGYLVRRMVNNKDYSVMLYYFYIIIRILTGLIISVNREINRKVYYSRLKGVISGFFMVLK
ncbi:glycosyltransferase family 2 protein [Shewanella sp.]|uniref:glycosyltransferase family 2 protein n=1 Tax=Shewanella sp. TaxID=50422 RepID=UPI003A870A88